MRAAVGRECRVLVRSPVLRCRPVLPAAAAVLPGRQLSPPGRRRAARPAAQPSGGSDPARPAQAAASALRND
ncbi:hypothetical protein [Plantactinospora mayteni]|uniref:hypothetical protein n=1 Tax=Plantactinospora mayteni TaxID=566021 RepID=UPI00194319CF|nr:hypothetical protein [Plantactinospora mayteni]